jgi:hypothetical protein
MLGSSFSRVSGFAPEVLMLKLSVHGMKWFKEETEVLIALVLLATLALSNRDLKPKDGLCLHGYLSFSREF